LKTTWVERTKTHLAAASWSLTWNYEADWQELFFDTYGVERDREHLDYYRLLWELTP
jgi:aminoglycoside phosphotransferase